MARIKLTAKQKKFINEYLIDFNGTAAAKRAGYAHKTAAAIATENLQKPYMQEFLQKRMRKREERTEISQDRVLREYARLAMFDVRKLYDENGNLKRVIDLDDDTAAAVSGIDVKKDGDETELLKYKTADKRASLADVARHLGMFEKDNSQKVPQEIIIKRAKRDKNE